MSAPCPGRMTPSICIVDRCDAHVAARQPFCAAHWRMIPGRLRSRLSLVIMWSGRPLTSDIQAALSAIAARSGGGPGAAPLADPDAPAVTAAGVSAPSSRSVETPAPQQARARGAMPETHDAP